MKKTKCNKKGFTILELIIAMAITSILMIAILDLIMPVKVIYEDTNEYNQARSAAQNSTKFLQEKLRYANDIIIINNAGDTWPSVLSGGDYTGYQVIKIDMKKQTVKNKDMAGRLYLKFHVTDADTSGVEVLGGTFDDYSLLMKVEKAGGAADTVETFVGISKTYADVTATPTPIHYFSTTSQIVCPNMKVASSKGITVYNLGVTGQISLLSSEKNLNVSSGNNTYIVIREVIETDMLSSSTP